jgi:hypothetical protein
MRARNKEEKAMRIARHSIALTATLLATAAACGASEIQQTPGSNVVISNCDLRRRNDIVESNFRATPYKSALTATLSLDYRNQAAAPMSAVVFGVVSDGKLIAIGEDSGRFAPGVPIHHQLVLAGASPSTGQTECIVLRVLYQNGTAWLNPHSPAQ